MTPLSSLVNPRRHEDIRAMLVAHAAASADQMPMEAAPLAWRRPGLRRIGLGVASAAAVAVTAAFLLTADPAAAPSYAGWSAVPQPAPDGSASAEDIERWASKCDDLGVGGVAVQGVPARPNAAADREVLVDRRGDFTYCVDVSGGTGTAADPLIALSGIKTDGRGGMNTMWTTVFDKPFPRPAASEVLVLGGDLDTPPPDDTAGDPGVVRLNAYQLYGLAGRDVTGVDIVLANGLRVTATVHSGIWGAWWPSDKGDPADSNLDIHTAIGTRTIGSATVQIPHG